MRAKCGAGVSGVDARKVEVESRISRKRKVVMQMRMTKIIKL